MAMLGAAVLGGATALLVDRTFFRPKQMKVPVIISEHNSQKSQADKCSDLYAYVCSLPNTKDPTGDVRRESEGEVDALRIFEEIVRSRRTIQRRTVDRMLVERIYTPERRKMINALFKDVREHLIAFIDAQPFSALTFEDKKTLKDRISRVTLEIPDPEERYTDSPDLLTSNEVYFERSKDGSMRIKIGGAIFFTVKSRFNLAFTLAHELAHAIDPCELKHNKIDILGYRGLSECFGSFVSDLTPECSKDEKLPEIFSDWAATHVVADLINHASKKFTRKQSQDAVYSSVRDLCTDDDYYDDQDKRSEYIASHPDEGYRVNYIFAQHPQIRKTLGCADLEGPNLPGVPRYCFWSMTQPGSTIQSDGK